MADKKIEPVKLSDIFLKRVIQSDRSKEEIEKDLRIFSKKHNHPYEIVLYTTILSILKSPDHLMRKINQETFDEMISEAARWSANRETKIKRKMIRDYGNQKTPGVGSKLLLEVVKSICAEKNNDYVKNIKLEKYISLFFDAAIISKGIR